MFVGCSEISTSFIVKHVQHVGIIRNYLMMKQQAFCMIFKGLLLKQIKQSFSEDASPTLHTIYHCTTKDCRTFFY